MKTENLLFQDSHVISVTFSPDGKYALSGSRDKTLKLWDIATGKELRTFTGHNYGVNSVSFSPDGKFALSGSEDTTMKVWDVHTGKEVATFFGFNDGEWVVITPEGYFNASEKGVHYVNVRIGNKVYDIDQFYNQFYRPELVELALSGKGSIKGETFGDVLANKPAPSVEILSPQDGKLVQEDKTIVSFKVKDNGGGVGSIYVYNNDSLVVGETRGVTIKEKETQGDVFKYTLSLVEGENKIKVVAFNKDNSMQSTVALVTVMSKIAIQAVQKPSLYAIIVGINQYKNESISLKFAVPDAQSFAEALKQQAPPLFENMEIKVLSSFEETTKESLKNTFLEMKEKVKPQDVFIFYNASHGTLETIGEKEQYYLLTSNVLLLSSEHITQDALSMQELVGLIGSISAQKKVLVFDSCYAGKAAKELQLAMLQTRGLTEATAIKLLQRAIGSAVFAASSSTEEALEGYNGHGLFTYLLVEGMQGGADGNKDGFISTRELADYVEEKVILISQDVFKKQQTPIIELGGNMFPVAKVK